MGFLGSGLRFLSFLLDSFLLGALAGGRDFLGYRLCPTLRFLCQRAGRLRRCPRPILLEPHHIPGVWVHDVVRAPISLHIVMVLAQAGQVARVRGAAVGIVDAVVHLA